MIRGRGVWPLLALWSARGDFGTHDPLFHRDVGFFVFSLPLYQQVSRWALEAIVMTAGATVAAYFAAGVLPRARAHLLVLAALALVVLAWRCRLDQFALAVPHDASVVPGASYADVHVRLPVRRVLVLVCLGVPILRRTSPHVHRPFKVPAPWAIGLLGAGACVWVMIGLPLDTWARLLVWLALGFVIYFTYGRKHSHLQRKLKTGA